MSDEGKIRMLVSGFLHPSDPAFSLEIIIVITWAHKISCRAHTMGVFGGQGSSQVSFNQTSLVQLAHVGQGSSQVCPVCPCWTRVQSSLLHTSLVQFAHVGQGSNQVCFKPIWSRFGLFVGPSPAHNNNLNRLIFKARREH